MDGYFEEIDRQFGRFLSTITGRSEPELALAAAMVSAETRQGHICFDLASGAVDRPLMPPLEEWLALLRGWEAVAVVDRAADEEGEDAPFRPLILDGANRLYLHRYWKYETDMAASMLRRGYELRDFAACDPALDRLFPPLPAGEPDGQRAAAATAIQRGVTLISGGPGTGKTTTVVKILALLVQQAGGAPIDIALAAPTGKAAARLKEAVDAARTKVDCDSGVRDRIPSEAVTLHRLLGAFPGTAKFRHGPGNPLPHDVVIVDEASMIDLPMMARLVGAMAPHARLILLGDRDQLSSVEPGKVFGDLCDTTVPNRLKDSIVVLTKSYRFDEKSGIGALSRLVNAGKGEAALDLLSSGLYPDIGWKDLFAGNAVPAELESAILEGYGDYLRETGVRRKFEAFQKFRVLCAHRQGAHGVEGINALSERVLSRAGLIHPRTPFYEGRPIMVTRNDYRIKLYNGDIGLVLKDPAAEGPAQVWFPADNGLFRAIPPVRLPEHVSAYALTVHKSQGSEFDRVLLLLGTVLTEAQTRELLYTGITRARRFVDVRCGRDVFLAAAARRTERKSGLKDALAG